MEPERKKSVSLKPAEIRIEKTIYGTQMTTLCALMAYVKVTSSSNKRNKKNIKGNKLEQSNERKKPNTTTKLTEQAFV